MYSTPVFPSRQISTLVYLLTGVYHLLFLSAFVDVEKVDELVYTHNCVVCYSSCFSASPE